MSSESTNPAGFPAVAVAPAGPPNEYAVTAKEPAPSAPAVAGMGTTLEAHSAQEALDKVAQEPSFLGKMATMAQPYLAKMDAVTQPYVEKVQTTTKPYTDAAAIKARELIDKIEGPGAAAPGTTTAAAAQGGDGATTTAAVPATTFRRGSKNLGPEVVGAEGEKPGLFDTITKTVSDITHQIDEKTASANKPGLITQLTSAVQKVTDKADAYIGSHAPNSTNVTSVIGHPVQTTTNGVPHTDKPETSDPAGLPPLTNAGNLAAGSAPSTQV